jgi:hypothetical protein
MAWQEFASYKGLWMLVLKEAELTEPVIRVPFKTGGARS